MNEKKPKPKYFSSVKPYAKWKKRRPLFRALLWLFRKFSKKSTVVFDEMPPSDEGVVLVANHALAYGPVSILVNYPRPNRMWSSPNLCYIKKVPNHAMISFFPKTKGIVTVLARIFSFMIAPFIPPIFRSLEVIPGYQNLDALISFKKSAETLAEGKDVVIFAETEVPHPDYKYVNNLNNGFIRIARMYHQETGKNAKFYPTYCCQKHKTILVGKPIMIDLSEPDKKQVAWFKKSLQDEIERLALSLPPHEPVPFNPGDPDPKRLERYGDKSKYSYKELRKEFASQKRYDERNPLPTPPNNEIGAHEDEADQ